ncbi:MAG TPA: DUF2911 domain-containing protein [Terriglobales bacterium]|nr:DUF2911 domain-containing protein [Terriglobales bacterium]
MKKLALIPAVLLVVASVAPAQMNQDKSKRPSPPASAECKFSDGKTVKIDYSSPRAKGRKIFGELVPFGEVWRTGANEATTFVAGTNVNVGGKEVPAGSYTIFTVPKADAWTLIISKKTGEWGTDYPGEKEDLARIPMTSSKTSGPVENFTINFEQGGKKCSLRMEWENTSAKVEVMEK